jgi:hypothetical protein
VLTHNIAFLWVQDVNLARKKPIALGNWAIDNNTALFSRIEIVSEINIEGSYPIELLSVAL